MVEGDLTIKNTTVPIDLDFEFKKYEPNGKAVAKGRTLFGKDMFGIDLTEIKEGEILNQLVVPTMPYTTH